MKKTISVLLAVAFLVGCTKHIDTPNPTATLGMGAAPMSTTITKVAPITSDGSAVTVAMNITTGAKYSLQAVDFHGTTTKIAGFTATSDTTIQTLNISNLKNGDYTLLLLDIQGNESKSNIVIKH